MSSNILYTILNKPAVYKLSQALLAPGAEKNLVSRLKTLSFKYAKSGNILDAGCGPASWLWKVNKSPIGLDILYPYSKDYHKTDQKAVTGSITNLPFLDKSFASVWSIGVLHHLPDDAARLAVKEMIRICKPKGYVIILDAVLPCSRWKRPQAYFIRSIDRGKFMRHESTLRSLLPQQQNWKISRYTYTLNGLEMLECVYSNIN